MPWSRYGPCYLSLTHGGGVCDRRKEAPPGKRSGGGRERRGGGKINCGRATARERLPRRGDRIVSYRIDRGGRRAGASARVRGRSGAAHVPAVGGEAVSGDSAARIRR